MKSEQAFYICRSKIIPGLNHKTVVKIARRFFIRIKNKSKRRPYIRSAYFKNEKIFLDNFWPHMMQKNALERTRRLKFIQCAIELIQKSKVKPIAEKEGISNKVILYRFLGRVNNHFFIVQIKEDLKRGQKFFMSVFKYTKK